MKNITDKAIKILLLLTLSLAFAACNDDDDLEEIFTGKTWKLTFVQNGVDRLVPESEGYSISFAGNSFVFKTPQNATINGNWYANGETRAFGCDNITKNGIPENDAIANAVFNILLNAVRYNGDANWIQIVEQPNNFYIQFYNR